MTPNTPRQFLEKILPTKFKPEKAAGFDAIVQIKLTGPDGGDWVIILKDKKLKIYEGIHPQPNLTLTIADSDFMDLVNGKLGTTEAFLKSKIELSGSLGLALKLKDSGLLDFNS